MQNKHPFYSMTGFGQAELALPSHPLYLVICRIKSLNHRFLDLKVRLPRQDLGSLELQIRKHISEELKRGSVEVSISIESKQKKDHDSFNVRLNEDALTKYMAFAPKIGAVLSKNGMKFEQSGLSMDSILKLPGVIEKEDISFEPEEIEPLIFQCYKNALTDIKTSRAKEGVFLQKHLLELIDQIDSHFKEVIRLEPSENERHRLNYKERVEKVVAFLNETSAGAAHASFEQRIKEEASILLEKRDFEEERIRLGGHIEQVRSMISTPGATVGKQLEFTQQEMLREVNTLGNKAQSTVISHQIVEMKSLLEKVREQIANVE